MASSSSSSTVGNRLGSGLVRPRFRSCSHCAAQLSTRLNAFGVGQHAAHLRLEHRRLAQRAGLGDAASAPSIGHAGPEEIREPRCQLDIAHGIFVIVDRRSSIVDRCAAIANVGTPDAGRSTTWTMDDSLRRGTGNSATPESPEAPGGSLRRTYRLRAARARPASSFDASSSSRHRTPVGALHQACSEWSARTACVFWRADEDLRCSSPAARCSD